MQESKKIPVGISSCLLGERVRYDGGHKLNSYVSSTLGEFFEFRAFCPEMSIGLGVPRKTIRLVDIDGQTHCQGTQESNLDVTESLRQCGLEQSSWHSSIYGYILKKDSPSCGMERVKVYKNDQPERKGVGIYAQVLMDRYPNLPVEEEGRLGDPVLRENFLQRVFAFRRWGEVVQKGVSKRILTEFHGQHKLTLLSHDQDLARDLGRELAKVESSDAQEYAPDYIAKFMALLKIKATRSNHVNVLQHIQGYLKKLLDSQDREELCEVIEEYRLGHLPLIVPITLLKHHFRRNPSEYILDSYYMNPHPKELMLRNSL